MQNQYMAQQPVQQQAQPYYQQPVMQPVYQQNVVQYQQPQPQMQIQPQPQQKTDKKFVPSKYRYPNQVACCKRKEFNLYANVILKPPTEQELISGDYSGFDALGGSRFDLEMFKYAEKKSIKFCLEPSAVKLIYLRIKANIEDAATKDKKTTKEKLPAAYTTVIKGNKLSGMVPAEILLLHPELTNTLMAQREYYAKNIADPKCAKFAKSNQNAVNAIDEAFALYRAGQLDIGKLLGSEKLIYDKCKVPNMSNLDVRGLTKVRLIKITYNENNVASPFTLKITNCMAPPLNRGNEIGANLEQATDKVEWSINLTEEEALEFFGKLDELCFQFGQNNIKRRLDVYNTQQYF